MITRRGLIGSLAAGAGGVLLSGCNKINADPGVRSLLQSAEGLTMRAQRIIGDRTMLAREFGAADLSPVFRSNGTRQPAGADYESHRLSNFADWRLSVDGLVARPQSFSMAQIRGMPRRTQITRHDCVEGWSAIGQWTGVPLKLLLDQAGLRSSARYLIFHCADRYAQADYYESIDLIDALHPQTILAWGLNRQLLPVGNGAPLRLRVERQLGYKHAKYVQRIEAVDSLASRGLGKGGYWEDYHDYAWYAGI
ncbi:molybdopterin-binding protein [Rhizorhabdus argentea]|uniref:molybdopterin-binding protein n=1 Tax=Rhizorhabdus argentea TaxID=1387174 RepID=UPI0030EC8E59